MNETSVPHCGDLNISRYTAGECSIFITEEECVGDH